MRFTNTLISFKEYLIKYYDPDIFKVHRFKTLVNTHNYRISTLKSLSTRSVSKQAKRAYSTQIKYHEKQRNSILDLYPEYFI